MDPLLIRAPKRQRDSKRRPQSSWRAAYADVDDSKTISEDEIDAAHALFCLANHVPGDTQSDRVSDDRTNGKANGVKRSRDTAERDEAADTRRSGASTDSGGATPRKSHRAGSRSEAQPAAPETSRAPASAAMLRTVAELPANSGAASLVTQPQPSSGGAAAALKATGAAAQPGSLPFAPRAGLGVNGMAAAQGSMNGLSVPALLQQQYISHAMAAQQPYGMQWPPLYGDHLSYQGLNGAADPRRFLYMQANAMNGLRMGLPGDAAAAAYPKMAAMGLSHAHRAMQHGMHPTTALYYNMLRAGMAPPAGAGGLANARCARHVHIAHMIARAHAADAKPGDAAKDAPAALGQPSWARAPGGAGAALEFALKGARGGPRGPAGADDLATAMPWAPSMHALATSDAAAQHPTWRGLAPGAAGAAAVGGLHLLAASNIDTATLAFSQGLMRGADAAMASMPMSVPPDTFCNPSSLVALSQQRASASGNSIDLSAAFGGVLGQLPPKALGSGGLLPMGLRASGDGSGAFCAGASTPLAAAPSLPMTVDPLLLQRPFLHSSCRGPEGVNPAALAGQMQQQQAALAAAVMPLNGVANAGLVGPNPLGGMSAMAPLRPASEALAVGNFQRALFM